MRYYQHSLHLRLNKYALFARLTLLAVACFGCAGLLASIIPQARGNPFYQLAIGSAAALLVLFGIGCLWMLADIVRHSRRLRALQASGKPHNRAGHKGLLSWRGRA
jgi:uncharacterized membrane protein YqjE